MRKNNFIKKFLFVCSVLLTTLAICAGCLFNAPKQAQAIKYDDTESYVTVGEIWNDSTKKFNGANLNKLYDLIVGASGSSYTDVLTRARRSTSDGITGYSSASIRANTYGKTNAQDVCVYFGGLKWEVVYLSTDLSANEDPILTLWLSGEQEAWLNRSAREGTYYGFVNTTDTQAGLFSVWNPVHSNYFSISNPTMMYGASYMNAVTLNNGGSYISGISGTDGSAVTSISTATQNSNSVFAKFTMDSFGLTQHLVKPRNVIWQTTQNSRSGLGISTYSGWTKSTTYKVDFNYNRANENSASNAVATRYYSDATYGSISSVVNNSYYYNWANSYVWLPSISETGGGCIISSLNSSSYYYWYFDGYYDGIWQTSTNQRMNHNGSGAVVLAGIGTNNVNSYAYTWTRTASYDGEKSIYFIDPDQTTSSGSLWYADATPNDYGWGSYRNCARGAVTNYYAVRPALHLNLRTAEAAKYEPKTDVNTCNVASIAARNWNPTNNPIPTLTVTNATTGATLVKDTDYTVEQSTITGPGNVTLTIKGAGDKYEGTKTVTYTLNARDIALAVKGNTLGAKGQFYTGVALTPSLSGNVLDYSYETTSSTTPLNPSGSLLSQGTDYTLTYSNNVNAGSATITITGANRYTGTTTASFSIVKPDAIGNVQWNPVVNNPPDLTIRDTRKGTTLTKDVDYTLVQSTVTGIGTVTLTLTGKGNYEGTTTATYSLTARDINLALRDNDLNIPTQAYTGTALTPKLSNLKDYAYANASSSTRLSPAGVALIEGSHFTYSYSNNVATGTAVVTLTGKDNYTGTATTYFTIGTPSISGGTFTLNKDVIEYKFGENLTSDLTPTLVVGGKTLTYNTEYRISFYDSTGTTNLSSITTTGTYVVRAEGVTSYTGSIDKTITVEKHTITSAYITISGEPVYSGIAKTIDVVVGANYTYGGVQKSYSLIEGTDYTVSYTNNINASSSAQVNVVGTGNFRGSASKTFTIKPKSISTSDIKVTLSESSVGYTGSSLTPSVTVRDEIIGRDLTRDTDYTIAYTNNTNVGQATITITGKGNYDVTTKKIANFVISQRNIDLVTIGTIADQYYTGSSIVPDLIVMDEGRTLTKNSDYTVVATNNTEVGTANITIVGRNNYTGSKSTVFTIIKANLSATGTTLTATPANPTYTGRSINPTITLSVTGTSYVSVNNYEVSVMKDGVVLESGVSSIIDVGTYIIIVTGKNNFEGTIQINYVVARADISSVNAGLNSNSFEYSGTCQRPIETLIYAGSSLRKGTDYTLEYRKGTIYGLIVAEPTDADTYYLVIEGIGNFEGTNSNLSFNITPASLTSNVVSTFTTTGTNTLSEIAFSSLSFVFDNSAKTVELTSVKIKGVEYLTGPYACLDVIYLRDEFYTTDFVNAGTITIKITSTGNNVQGEKTYSYTIRKRNLSTYASGIVVSGLTDVTYDRNPHNDHSLTIIDGDANGYRLGAEDYTLNYPTDCTSAQTSVPVRIIGSVTGNYEGELTKSFRIKKAVIDSFEILSSTGKYNALAHTIIATVSAGSLTLESSEFSLAYSRNGVATTDLTNTGVIAIVVNAGNTNYEVSGTIQPKTYTITSIEISSVVLSKTQQVFDNVQHELTIANVMGEDNVILLPTDYEVQWIYNRSSSVPAEIDGRYFAKNVGTYDLTVSGKRNTTGHATATFTITAREITPNIIKYYQVDSTNNFITKDGQRVQVDLETNYRGQRVRPEIVMVLGSSEYTLVMSTLDSGSGNPSGDFTFGVYNLGADITNESNNILKNSNSNYISVGQYNFVIRGINNFSGTIEKIYKVNLAEFNQSDIVITIYNEDSIIYTGSPITFNFNTSPTNIYNEVKVEHVDEKQTENEKRIEIYLGTDFVLYSGYVQIEFNPINENEIKSATIVDASTVAGYTPAQLEANNILHIQNGYINNNSVGWGAFVLASKDGSAFINNLVVIKRFRIRKLVLTAENTSVGVNAEYVYTGSPVINPAEIILIKDGTTQLDYNSDYEVTLTNYTNVGEVTMTIVGINSYEGSFTKKFAITPKAIVDSMFTVSANVTYNGSKQEPTITGSFAGANLVLDMDYSVSSVSSKGTATDFIKADTITITITGKNNFTGDVIKTFTIAKQVVREAVIDGESQEVFNGATHTFSVLVKDVLGNVVNSSEYTLIYSSEDFINAGTIRINVSLVESSNYTFEGSIGTTFTIAKAQLSSVTYRINDVVYTGYVNRPEKTDITLTLGASYVLKSTEFEIESVVNSLNISTPEQKATVTLNATGSNFEGKKEIQFSVTPRSIETVTFSTYRDDLPYNAQSQVPTFTLFYSSKLVENRDYEVKIDRTYGAPDRNEFGVVVEDLYINVGTFRVTIRGIGNFNGSVTKTYSISARSLSNQDTRVDVTYAESEFVYTGYEIRPTVTKIEATISSVKIELRDDDYTYDFVNNINAGSGTIVINGNGNFTGVTTKTFAISQKELKASELNVYVSSKQYIADRIHLSSETDVSIYTKDAYGQDAVKIASSNYEVTCLVLIQNVGEYDISIKGKENYKGSIQAKLNVTPISLSSAVVLYKESGNPTSLVDFFRISYSCVSVETSVRESIVVRVGEISLRYGTDFIISYDSEDLADERYLIDSGLKNFVIKPRVGNNNIIGEKSSSFEILKRDLEDCDFSFISDSYTYDGGAEIRPQYILTYNNIPLRKDVDYTEGFSNANNVGTASIAISASDVSNNFVGYLVRDYYIIKAKPVVQFSDPDRGFYAGDEVSKEAFELKAFVGEREIYGNLSLDNNKRTTLELGDNTFKYTFIPNDRNNYEEVSGTLRITAVNYVEVTFTYNNGPVVNVIAGTTTRINVVVRVKRGSIYTTLVKGVDYDEIITLVDTNEEVLNISRSGRYEISVEMYDPINNVIQNDSSIEFYAKSKILYAKDAPFYAVLTGGDYFEEGVELVVESYSSRRDIVSIIGAENYDSISNIGKVYKVVGLFKNDEEISTRNISVYYEPQSNDLYLFNDDKMSSAYRDGSTLQVDIGSFVIEAERASNTVLIIALAAVGGLVLIAGIFIVIKVMGNRKYKMAMAANSGRVDLDRLNAMANAASSARTTGNMNVQTMLGLQNQQAMQQGYQQQFGQMPQQMGGMNQMQQPYQNQQMGYPQQGMMQQNMGAQQSPMAQQNSMGQPNQMGQQNPQQMGGMGQQNPPRPMNNGMAPQQAPHPQQNSQPNGMGTQQPPRPMGAPQPGAGMPQQHAPTPPQGPRPNMPPQGQPGMGAPQPRPGGTPPGPGVNPPQGSNGNPPPINR